MSGYCLRCGNTHCLCYLEFKEDCVCGETSSRNCPVHQNDNEHFRELENIQDMLNYEQSYSKALSDRNDELETALSEVLEILEVNQKYHPTEQKALLLEKYKTTCKDCGVRTKFGKRSARCPSCWEDRCGHSTDNDK